MVKERKRPVVGSLRCCPDLKSCLAWLGVVSPTSYVVHPFLQSCSCPATVPPTSHLPPTGHSLGTKVDLPIPTWSSGGSPAGDVQGPGPSGDSGLWKMACSSAHAFMFYRTYN